MISTSTREIYRCWGNLTLLSWINAKEYLKKECIWITLYINTISVSSKLPPVQIPLNNKLYLCISLSPSLSTDIFTADVCGPDKELDVETCQCVCRHRDHIQDCGPNQYLNSNTCQCVCNVPPPSCPFNHVFNKETCQCICIKTCPRHQPLNKTKCSCECNESPNKCFLKGRRFHQPTCR